MHIDLYPAHREAKHDPHAAEDFLDLLRQQGFQPTKSLAEGSLLCDLSEQPWESFLEAIRHWQAVTSHVTSPLSFFAYSFFAPESS